MIEILEYQILEYGSVRTLAYAVNQAIKEGWQPYGPLTCQLNVMDTYKQAMVKYAAKPT